MTNLISTTDFNIQQYKELIIDDYSNRIHYPDIVFAYAKMLKRPIEKNMFVPCSDDGDIFQTPTSCDKPCSPIDFCEGGKCHIEGCYAEVSKYVEASMTVLFDGWFGFTNSLSKAEMGIANEVTNGDFTIYFYKDKFPFFVEEGAGFIEGFNIETIEDLLKAGIEFKLTDNFKKQIKGLSFYKK